MSANTIYFRGTRQEAKQAIRSVVSMVGGNEPDTLGVKRGVALSMGFAVLSDVKDAYVEKARGGTGEDGVKWAPLKPETIRNRRIGPGDKKANPDIAAREKEVKKRVKQLVGRYLVSMPPKMALETAKRVAQSQITRETKKTTVNVYGGRSVEILHDTGILMNSLSPGVLSGDGLNVNYSPPTQQGGEQQLFDVTDNGFIVGTNVAYAATHQYGSTKKNIPARPFLPTNGQVPAVWWRRWLDVARAAVLEGIKLSLQVRK